LRYKNYDSVGGSPKLMPTRKDQAPPKLDYFQQPKKHSQ
jgi:hypothetical protein